MLSIHATLTPSSRTGVAPAKIPSKTRAPLPASGKDLDRIFSISGNSPTENQERDRCWREEGIELRAKALHTRAFVDSVPVMPIQGPDSKLFVASSAIHVGHSCFHLGKKLTLKSTRRSSRLTQNLMTKNRLPMLSPHLEMRLCAMQPDSCKSAVSLLKPGGNHILEERTN
jgi:hypothetical protein